MGPIFWQMHIKFLKYHDPLSTHLSCFMAFKFLIDAWKNMKWFKNQILPKYPSNFLKYWSPFLRLAASRSNKSIFIYNVVRLYLGVGVHVSWFYFQSWYFKETNDILNMTYCNDLRFLRKSVSQSETNWKPFNLSIQCMGTCEEFWSRIDVT